MIANLLCYKCGKVTFYFKGVFFQWVPELIITQKFKRCERCGKDL